MLHVFFPTSLPGDSGNFFSPDLGTAAMPNLSSTFSKIEGNIKLQSRKSPSTSECMLFHHGRLTVPEQEPSHAVPADQCDDSTPYHPPETPQNPRRRKETPQP